MDKISPEQRESIKKLSTERVRSRLVALGFDEDQIFATERPELLELLAEQVLNPKPVSPPPGLRDEVRIRELALEELKLKLEAEREQIALRTAEMRLQERRFEEDLELRRQESDRLRARDALQAERDQSLASQTKRYGDILKHVLPRMPTNQADLVSWWDTCERIWALYEVPTNLRSKLLLPLLTPKAKSIVGRMESEELADVGCIRKFLMREFKLTSREYRARFNTASRDPDETHALFTSRLKNLWSSYMRSRECSDYDKLVDLVISDRLKDSLSGPCLKYCLAIEGCQVLSAEELAALADTFDANYTPEGRYRGESVTHFKDMTVSNNNNKSDRPRVPPLRPPPPQNVSRRVSQLDARSMSGAGSSTRSDAVDSRSGTRPQRRCWICQSPYHMQSACPEKARTGNQGSRPSFQSAQVKTCAVPNPTAVVENEEAAMMNVQVNRCIVQCPEELSISSVSNDVTVEPNDYLIRGPVTLKLGTHIAQQTTLSESDVGADVQGQERCSSEARADCNTDVVRTSPLTYCHVFVENSGPVKCLADSGSELSIAKRSIVDKVKPQANSVGQIKLQGMFGEPVVAELVNLQVALGTENNSISDPVPVTFAVTDAMVQDCDLVMPVEVLQELKTHLIPCPPVFCCVVTRSQARDQVITENGGLAPTDQTVVVETPDLTDGHNGPLVQSPREDTDTSDEGHKDLVSVDNPALLLVGGSDRDKLIAEQKADTTLDPYWRMAAENKGGMFIDDGMLCHKDEVCGYSVTQLCVPHGRRLQVLHMAHDLVASGHLRNQKTRERVRMNFFWPGVKQDILSYISSCQPCQLRARAKRLDHVPITPVIRPTIPFVMCHADVIGPIEPPSSKGHRWLLCVVDDCTRWPAVYLLRSLTAKATCDAFMELFSITGWPEIINTDQATNFCSRLTQEFLSRMGVSPRVNSPYHPEASGLVERFNSTFKNMLHHAIREYGRQWHRVVPCLVWALREVPNSTTSVSPHFLLFGRIPRGPLSILKESWIGYRDNNRDTSKPVDKYISDLEIDMRNAERYAQEHANIAQQKYAKYYNAHTKDKSFQIGDQVVVLEKDSTHKTFARWKQGKIVRVRSPYSYDVEMPDGTQRQLHANKIRKLVVRTQHVGVINDQDADFGPVEYAPVDDVIQNTRPSEKVDRAQLDHLSEDQQEALLAVIDDFQDVFSDSPGYCDVVEHEIHVTPDFKPRMTRAYRVPETLKQEIERQVDELLKLGFIVPSKSPMASGVVCVLKPDKTIRMACDYRYVNSYTIGDAFPMPNLFDVMHRVGKGRYITVTDARSGYYQLPVRREHRWLTAFATHHGLWEWTRMPFGLKAAGNTFVRAVQTILQPIRDHSDSYVDDLATFSDEFQSHLVHLRRFLEVMRTAGLTMNIKKCSFAQQQVRYLGHMIGSGKHHPDPDRLRVVNEMKPPTTKRQLRRVLGLFSYYRTYVKEFAMVAKPLTDLTGSRKPMTLIWGENEQRAFDELRQKICEAPVLAVPQPGKPFQLYTDASDTSVACQLAQCDELGDEHPVAYASSKLTVTQCNWAVIEREAYAIVWALSRFHNIIFGAPIVVFCDHNPLKFLTESAPKSAKLTRWSLALQAYDLTIKYLRGTSNKVADCLSRLSSDR